MTRTIFFWVAAVISALFGLLMLFAPHVAANQFGMAGSADTNGIFRVLGATLLSIGLLNFLVRSDPPSSTLRAVLWTDVSIHAVGAVADTWSIVAGDITDTVVGCFAGRWAP